MGGSDRRRSGDRPERLHLGHTLAARSEPGRTSTVEARPTPASGAATSLTSIIAQWRHESTSAEHLDEDSPELLADEAVEEEVDRRVEGEEEIGDWVDDADVWVVQRLTAHPRDGYTKNWRTQNKIINTKQEK